MHSLSKTAVVRPYRSSTLPQTAVQHLSLSTGTRYWWKQVS